MKILPSIRRCVVFLLLPAAMLAVLGYQDAARGHAPAAEPFAAARLRGELVVGMPQVTPAPAAGARIRTPERLDEAAALALARRLQLPLRMRQLSADQAARALAAGEVDAVLADIAAALPAAASAGAAMVPTAYAARPKAVLRSDTSIHRWQDLAGRSVCVSSAAPQAGAQAAKWGARVRAYPVPSDALVAVRTGQCDAALIDDAVWGPLMQFPEWKKFSASLPADGPSYRRVWLLPAADGASVQWLEHEMRRWERSGMWRQMSAKWARDVAFDVYLDQEVPDCHG